MECTHTNITWNLAQSEAIGNQQLSLAGTCEECDAAVHGTASVDEVTPE